MSRRKKEQEPEPVPPEAVDLPDEEGPAESDGPQYTNCPCGARLVLEEEIANGKCEQCQPLAPVAEETEETATLYPPGTPEGDAQQQAMREAAPSQPSLFPPEPFDETAALKDMFAKNRAVEAYIRQYEEAKEHAADLKKQWEAAAKTHQQATAEYERKYRAWAEAEERQRQLVDAYAESIETTAAVTVSNGDGPAEMLAPVAVE